MERNPTNSRTSLIFPKKWALLTHLFMQLTEIVKGVDYFDLHDVRFHRQDLCLSAYSNLIGRWLFLFFSLLELHHLDCRIDEFSLALSLAGAGPSE